MQTTLNGHTKERVYTVAEATKALNRSDGWIYTRIYNGQLIATKSAEGFWNIPQSSIDAMKQELTGESTSFVEEPLPQQQETEEPTNSSLEIHVSTPPVQSEITLLNTVINAVFTSTKQPATLQSFQEVKPDMRVWNMTLQTNEGLMTYRAVYDNGQVSVQQVAP